MSTLFNIRRLTVTNTEQYRKILLSALNHVPEAFDATYADDVLRSSELLGKKMDSAIIFGAYLHGDIIGMIEFEKGKCKERSHKGIVWGLYVEPEYRCRGAGAALMAALIETAQENVQQLTLCVKKTNERAVSLCKRFGYEVYGVEPRSVRCQSGYADELLMVLMLPLSQAPAQK